MSFELVCGRESASVLLDDLAREPDTSLDGVIELLALHDLGDEAANKGVSCTVGINDQILRDGGDGEFFGDCLLTLMVNGHENGVMALGDDGNTRSLGVDLLPFSDGEAHILEGGVLDFVSFSEAFSLIFVAEDVVGMLKHGIDFISVELDQEAGGEVVTEGLVVLSGEVSVVQEGVVV